MASKKFVSLAVVTVVILAGIVGAVIILSTGNQNTAGDLVIMDDRGQNVTIPKYPQRIISLGTSFTEILFAIGADHQVVGVDKTSTYPSGALSKTNVGSFYTLNAENVTILEPDCVITWTFATNTISTLEGLGIPVIAYNPTSISDTMRVIESIGNATGKSSAAVNLVNQMEDKVEAVTSKLSGINPEMKPKAYFELRNGKTVGPGALADELISLAGGINIYGSNASKYPQPSTEFIVESNPDVIIVENQSPKTNDDFVEWIGIGSGVNAVDQGKIYRINGALVTACPRVVDALEMFARWFYPELFT
jgi:iron complex transport system substrate-binding protein